MTGRLVWGGGGPPPPPGVGGGAAGGAKEDLHACVGPVLLDELHDVVRGAVGAEDAGDHGDAKLLQRAYALFQSGVVRVGPHQQGDAHEVTPVVLLTIFSQTSMYRSPTRAKTAGSNSGAG